MQELIEQIKKRSLMLESLIDDGKLFYIDSFGNSGQIESIEEYLELKSYGYMFFSK